MFIGHFAVGFGAKRAVPAVSLGSLFLACQLADLLWPNFVLLGLERFEIDPGNTAFTPLDFVSYPYSHSLVALLGWGLAFANLVSPPPPSTAAVAWTAQAVWLIVAWGYWIDRHRQPRAAEEPRS